MIIGDVLPCPFCGNEPSLTYGDRSRMFTVSCEDGCGAEGPPHVDSQVAVSGWNNRANPAVGGESSNTTTQDEIMGIIDGWMQGYDFIGTGSTRSGQIEEAEWAKDRERLICLLRQRTITL